MSDFRRKGAHRQAFGAGLVAERLKDRISGLNSFLHPISQHGVKLRVVSLGQRRVCIEIGSPVSRTVRHAGDLIEAIKGVDARQSTHRCQHLLIIVDGPQIRHQFIVHGLNMDQLPTARFETGQVRIVGIDVSKLRCSAIPASNA